MAEEKNHKKYIQKKLKEGMSPNQLVDHLVESGWQHDVAQREVAEANTATPPPPPPDVPAPPNATSQTGNSGTPMQVENVQYNMGVKTVESRVGTFLKISAVGLWFTVVFVSWFLAALLDAAFNDSSDLAEMLVFTVSLSAVSVPTFVFADRKMRAELAKNRALVDDLFFKKNVRTGLNASIGLTAVSIFFTLFLLLSAMFISDSDVDGLNAFQALVFAGGFGGALYYYWQLHAMTKR